MPKIPIDECPAGAEMDAAVAVALGWKLNDTGDEWLDAGGTYMKAAKYWRIGGNDDILPWKPSTDIATAWEMESALEVDAQSDYVMALFNLVTIDLGAPDFYTFKKSVYWQMVHASPLDRCRAFLKTNGVEFIEVPE